MRVLVATDGFEIAGVALDQAIALASKTAGSLHVVAVVPPPEDLFGGPPPAPVMILPESLAEAAERELRAILDRETRRVPAGLPVTSALRTGRPATEILAEAQHWAAEMIVVGSRGHSDLAAMLLGSVSQEVVDRSSVPVLVARRRTVDRFLVGVDPSGSADEAIGFLVRHELPAGSSVRVVGALAPRYPWWFGAAALEPVAMPELAAVHDEAVAAGHRAVEDAVCRLRTVASDVSSEIAACQPAEALIAAIERWDADLAVVGSRRRDPLAAAVLGSVARQVLHHAPSSMLVVHPQQPAVLRTPRPAAESAAPESRSIR